MSTGKNTIFEQNLSLDEQVEGRWSRGEGRPGQEMWMASRGTGERQGQEKDRDEGRALPGMILGGASSTQGQIKISAFRRSTLGPRLSPPPTHSSFLPPPDSPTRFIRSMSGRNIAMTMLPTITARNTIMIGSSRDVMAATALSTSSS